MEVPVLLKSIKHYTLNLLTYMEQEFNISFPIAFRYYFKFVILIYYIILNKYHDCSLNFKALGGRKQKAGCVNRHAGY
jgi:hypothetical protein